jgi:tRNA (guanine10-N2)-methyltransferase
MHPHQVRLFNNGYSNFLLLKQGYLRSIHQFFAQGRNYDELHADNQTSRAKDLWSKYIHTSFKFSVTGYNHTISGEYQRNIMESFSYMAYLGKIDMKNPEIILSCYEECMPPFSLCRYIFSLSLTF